MCVFERRDQIAKLAAGTIFLPKALHRRRRSSVVIIINFPVVGLLLIGSGQASIADGPTDNNDDRIEPLASRERKHDRAATRPIGGHEPIAGFDA